MSRNKITRTAFAPRRAEVLDPIGEALDTAAALDTERCVWLAEGLAQLERERRAKEASSVTILPITHITGLRENKARDAGLGPLGEDSGTAASSSGPAAPQSALEPIEESPEDTKFRMAVIATVQSTTGISRGEKSLPFCMTCGGSFAPGQVQCFRCQGPVIRPDGTHDPTYQVGHRRELRSASGAQFTVEVARTDRGPRNFTTAEHKEARKRVARAREQGYEGMADRWDRDMRFRQAMTDENRDRQWCLDQDSIGQPLSEAEKEARQAGARRTWHERERMSHTFDRVVTLDEHGNRLPVPDQELGAGGRRMSKAAFTEARYRQEVRARDNPKAAPLGKSHYAPSPFHAPPGAPPASDDQGKGKGKGKAQGKGWQSGTPGWTWSYSAGWTWAAAWGSQWGRGWGQSIGGQLPTSPGSSITRSSGIDLSFVLLLIFAAIGLATTLCFAYRAARRALTGGQHSPQPGATGQIVNPAATVAPPLPPPPLAGAAAAQVVQRPAAARGHAVKPGDSLFIATNRGTCVHRCTNCAGLNPTTSKRTYTACRVCFDPSYP